VFFYDVQSKHMSAWSKDNTQNLPDAFTSRNNKVAGIIYNPSSPLSSSSPQTNTNTIVLYGLGFFCAVDLSKRADDPSNFRLQTKYKPVMFMEFVARDELVVVERPWQDVASHFPDTLWRPRYGT